MNRSPEFELAVRDMIREQGVKKTRELLATSPQFKMYKPEFTEALIRSIVKKERLGKY